MCTVLYSDTALAVQSGPHQAASTVQRLGSGSQGIIRVVVTPVILETSVLEAVMVILNTVPEPPLVDVVLLVEDTALGGLHLQELKTHYIIPALEHFNGGPASDLDFASLKCSSSFSVVPFYASDCLPLPPSKIVGPFTSTKKVLNVLDKLELRGGKGETHSSGQEGLANALQLFKEV